MPLIFKKYNILVGIVIIFCIAIGTIAVYGYANLNDVKLYSEVNERIEELDDIYISPKVVNPDTLYDFLFTIKNQEEFNALSSWIPKKMLTCSNILIKIEGGRYFSNTDHVLLENLNYPDCSISVVGDGDVTIMQTSHNLMDAAHDYDGYKIVEGNQNESVDPEDIFTDGRNPIHLSILNGEVNGGVTFTDKLFEKINPNDKSDLRYRLKSSLLPDLSGDECRNLWLWATHSWTSAYEKIDSVSQGYVYLTPDHDIELYQCSLNTDYRSWKIMPRIKVVNYQPSDSGVFIDKDGMMFLPDNYSEIFKCDKGSFFNLKNSQIKSFEISGIKFVGGKEPVIDIDKVIEYVYIHDCEFVSQQNSAVRIKSDNGIVYNNSFRNSWENLIEVPNGGYKNHIISNNKFSNCGQRLLNRPCVRVIADSVLISHNQFLNNLNCAVSVGLWYGHKPKGKIFTIVEDNLIYNDETLLKDYCHNSLLDVSLLYSATKNDLAVIRRNRIHGLRTLASGNGIYVDDGAYNVNVYDNIVTGIDGKLYNINCRSHIGERAKENAPEYSTNNFIANNIVDGPVRYELRDDKDACRYPRSCYGGSKFIYSQENTSFKNKFENVSTDLDGKYGVSSIGLQIKSPHGTYDFLATRSGVKFLEFLDKWISE